MRLRRIIAEARALTEMDQAAFATLMGKEADYHLGVAKRKGYVMVTFGPGTPPIAIETADGGKTFEMSWGGHHTVKGTKAQVKPKLIELLSAENQHLST